MLSVLIALSALATIALGPWLSQLGGGIEIELWERGRKALRSATSGDAANAPTNAQSTGNVRVIPSKIDDGHIEERDEAKLEAATAHAT